MPRRSQTKKKNKRANKPNSFSYTSSTIALSEGSTATREELLRTGKFHDVRYGWFEVTHDMLLSMVNNFNRGVFGQNVFVDVNHSHGNGAAAEVMSLSIEGNTLVADLDWTPFGVQMNRERKLCYLSSEYAEDYKDNETGITHGPLLKGVGLTIRPVIKHQRSIKLSSGTETARNYINPALQSKETITMNEELKRLLAELKKAALSALHIKQLSELFETSAKGMTDDAQIKTLCDSFIDSGKKLSEAVAGDTVTLEIKSLSEAPAPTTVPADKVLSATDVGEIIAKHERDRETAKQAADKTLSDKQKIFDDALAGAEGLTSDTTKTLSSIRSVITSDMTDEQVQALADHQITQGSQMEVSRQLSSMGYRAPVAGNISVGGDQSALSLQLAIDQGLKTSGAFINSDIKLSETTQPFVDEVLKVFDHSYGKRLSEENKVLSGDGQTSLDSAYIPASFQRTVIREVLHDLRILQLVQKLTDAGATMVTNVPYEKRDNNQVMNDGIVFEGQGIPFANVGTDHDTAYVLAMKLALKVSNEVMHFTNKSLVNWNAWGENVRANVRIIKELVVRRLANEIQRTSDSFEAMDVSAESVASQLDGSVSTIVTANFPIVRPFQQYDMKGNTIGSAENPITLTVDGTAVTAWDGTGTQTAGTYYVLKNLNLGHIQLVSESATLTPVTVSAAAATLSYSAATNIVKFDMNFDDSTTEYKKHLNGLLSLVGDQKAMMKSQRFVMPEYLLMSETLNNEITKATEFITDAGRKGTDTNFEGDLEKVKGIQTFGTDAPGIDLGDNRIHMGQRNTTTYTVIKPFQTGKAFEAVNTSGQPTGEQVAYGEEYNSIYTPLPIRNRSTGVVVFDSTTREVVS